MDIGDWRKQIDEIDPQIVKLLNQRATAAIQIGRIKRNTDMPIREHDREREVLRNISRANQGPLSNTDLHLIFESIMDIMRNIQKSEIVSEDSAE
ncbi:MAG TPA: chorismate mutase [Terriglobales bacterium]|jgi:chorismate mutase|nr:chorismate mutase [Terriglobales bacterium]